MPEEGIDITTCPYCGSEETSSYSDMLTMEVRLCDDCSRFYTVRYKVIPIEIITGVQI